MYGRDISVDDYWWKGFYDIIIMSLYIILLKMIFCYNCYKVGFDVI